MKPVYSPSSKGAKDRILRKYPNLSRYFDALEGEIEKSPHCVACETILEGGKRYTTYRRCVKTDFFSGMLPDTYLFITLNYAITTDNRIAVLHVLLHDYPE
jgi:hypothetical protein